MKTIEKITQKAKSFGKKSTVFAVMVILMASIGTAALLSSYGTVTGTANVSQGVIIVGDTTYTIGNSPAIAGHTYTNGVFTVKNNAENPATVTLNTMCNNSVGYDDGVQTGMTIDWSAVGGWQEECDGVVTSYYGVLELTSKDSTWTATADMKATLYYTVVGNEFGYDLTATGLTPGIEYSLIYYADKPDRFVNWGGNNPGALIVEATSDANGDLVATGNNNLGMSLPSPNDANIDEYNYCLSQTNGGTGDMYEHCTGAKLWIVPSSDYTKPALTAWNPSTYLFETDLICYTESIGNEITLPANGGGFDFVVENKLDVALAPDTYIIKTDVAPV